MKILHINQSDIAGGAAIAGYRLHQELLSQGVDSKLLVGNAKTQDERVATVPRKPRLEKNLERLTFRLSLHYVHLLATFDLTSHPFFKEADVLHFHNLHHNYFNYLALAKLTAQKPAIYTLHDMWSFTGHCAYSFDCQRWQSGCGSCPYPDTYPAIWRDNTHWEWKLKNWVYQRSNLTIVTPSRWLADLAQQSMLSRFPIHHIPNGIDTQAYQPLDQRECRSILGITNYKYVLMVGADNVRDYRKGGDLLIKSLQLLPESLKTGCLLLILGNGGEFLSQSVGIPSLNLGYVSNDRLKSIAYSAADLFLLPTRSDNLPIVLQESMACGIPMVSYDVGGVSDLVRPRITGYLAKAENVEDFTKGIVELLENKQLWQKIAHTCRNIAITEYSLGLQAQNYQKIYQQALLLQDRDGNLVPTIDDS